MRRSSLVRTSRQWLLYQALRGASAGGRKLSLKRARALGRGIGELAWRTLSREKKKAIRNIGIAFPEMEEAERRELAHAMFRHLGTSLGEITWMPNLDRATLEATTDFEGLEHFHAAADRKQGVVLFTGHCGNWEWMAAAIGLLGFDMNVIARDLTDPRLNQFIVETRARHSIKSIGRGSTAAGREILQTLRSGAVLGLLIDQNLKVESAMVDFFGKPASTPIGPAKLAIRAGAVALAGFIERRGDRQLLRFEPPIETKRTDDAVELTALMTKAIENQIRRVPEQWVWMHERWRERKIKN